jgi:hypothetical protein
MRSTRGMKQRCGKFLTNKRQPQRALKYYFRWVQYLTIWDLILTPVFLVILIAIAKKQRDKRYPVGHPLRKYYLAGLYVKFLGAIFIALIYQFYYNGGDTYNYFTHSKVINSALSDSFDTWIKLLLRKSPDAHPGVYKYASQLEWYSDPSSYTVAVIGALFGLLNGTTYLPIALLFAYVAYSGIWAMYKTFVMIYPKLYKELAIAFLFIPSTIVWGSGIFKDTICMFGLGWMVHCTFRIFINNDLSFRNMFLLALSFYLVAVIKLYILIAFIPALSLWLLLTYAHRVRSIGLRVVISLLFISITVSGFIFFSRLFAQEMNKYSLEKISQTADLTRTWIVYASGDEGSTYDIGPFNGTIGNTIQKFPAGVVVTLFRPFPWEVKKVIVALSALEALLFLFFTIKLIFSRQLSLKIIFRNPTVLFCLCFALIFAFSVGITSGNFGALSRYKIPCLPFYASFLLICLNYHKVAVGQKTTRNGHDLGSRKEDFLLSSQKFGSHQSEW